MKTLFNNGWLFAKAPVGTAADDPSLHFEPVDIPHDWLIYDAENLYESSFGIYKKRFTTRAARVRVYFEGVYQDCTVYVNGKAAAEHKYGYSSFEADITPLLCSGENELTVLVRHQSPNSRWYSGAGIFRNVSLIETESSCLVTDGVYFSAKREGASWRCEVSAEKLGEGELRFSLERADGEVLCSGAEGSLYIENAPVWDIDSPELLILKAQLVRGGEVIDEITQRVGLREAEFRPDGGFFLNGRHVKLHGVCLHHDQGALGAAFNKEAERRRLLLMKEMGVNSVRTSHNMPAVGFMELCDELGILVDSEAYDMWERPKTEFDYARFFDEWFERDVASWVRRDRNHPSVIMWSIGNEIYDTHVSDRGREVAKALNDAVRKHDPRRNACTTIGSNYMPWEGAQNCAKQVDLAGYNYGENCYYPHHESYPDWKIYGSETTSGVKSRGVYHFPLSSVFLTHDDLQCSSLGNCRAGASAQTAQQIIAADAECPFCAGMYIWTGGDYIGEPTPYSTKNSYYGSIDTAGLKKDSFWLYRAAWTDKPTLHMFPYWDFNEGQLIDVVAYTNLSCAELFVNGRSAGRKAPENYTVTWCVPYEKGEIKAVGYDKGGKEQCVEIRRSFGDSAALVLSCNKTSLLANGCDLCAVEISAVDKDKNPVENARDRVLVTVEGARLVGFDNGDSTDYDSYKSCERKLFGGKAAALVMSSDKAGTAVIRAEAPGLSPAEIRLSVLPAEPEKGTAFAESIAAKPHSGIIPIRKIELSRSGGSIITPETNGIRVTAEVFPKNASFGELKWSAVTDSGIATSAVRVEPDGSSAVLTALGDGSFRLRCSAANGKPQAEVISEYEFCAEGFGQAFTDPYEFVPACFFGYAKGEMDEVSDGGISVTEDKNVLGFTKVDFGKYGTERFKIRCIHWHTDDPVAFSLYDGVPDDGGRLIGEFTYQADFIWQTYRDNEFRLSERLCGERDIYFVFGKHQRLYFGGFVFEPVLKAYEKISAADAELIHGDTYEIAGDKILGIGNNVFIDFLGMDFARGISSVTLYGRTRHDNDSVHLTVVSDNGRELREIIEFAGSEDYTSVTVPLGDFRGSATVKLGFLPGCDFDLEGIRFAPSDE